MLNSDALLLPFSTEQGKKIRWENSLVEKRQGDHVLLTITGKTDPSWGN